MAKVLNISSRLLEKTKNKKINNKKNSGNITLSYIGLQQIVSNQWNSFLIPPDLFSWQTPFVFQTYLKKIVSIYKTTASEGAIKDVNVNLTL